MDKELRQRILNEAIRIGDELLSQAERDEHGLSWQTMSVDHANNRQIVWRKSEGIYSGVSGIVLFLLELYRQTKDEKYLQAAVEGMHWTEWYCQNNPTDYYAFFTGRMGVAYTMLRMAEVTRDNDYLEKALTIAKPCPVFLDSPKTVNDLINGTSGTLLALLHLHVHAATGQGWLLETINLYIEHLLRSAHHGPVGLYWDRSPHHIRGLCGFSHGAAGVGFVFLELGHYFQNEAFYWLAEQAFLYESHFFDEARQNWPDFRRRVSDPEGFEEHKKAYLAGNLDYFTEFREMNAWCHGAAGIGLSRIRALELLRKPIYKDDVENAIAKTITTDVSIKYPAQTYTLCHGGGGNAELFLEAYRIFKDKANLSSATKLALNALKFKERNNFYLSGFGYAGMQEDTSLFMGNAGIGYFYLKLCEPDCVPSVLAPKVETIASPTRNLVKLPYLTIAPDLIQKIILKKHFKRTLFVLEQLRPETVAAYFVQQPENNRLAIKEPFIEFLKDILLTLPPQEQKLTTDIFALELEKMRIDEAVTNHTLLHIKNKVTVEQNQKLLINLDSSSFGDLKLELERDIRIKLTDWSWGLAEPKGWLNNLSLEPAEYAMMLKPEVEGTIETTLSPFVYTILTVFQRGKQVDDAIREIIKAFDVISSKQEQAIKETVLQQIQHLLSAGILIAK